MDSIKSVLEIVRSRQLVLIVSLVIGLIGAGLVLRFMPRAYEASARVLIVNVSAGRQSVSASDLPSVATSTVVLERVLRNLKIPVTLIGMKHALKAHVAEGSNIMEIDYRDVSANNAVAVPNAIADELVRYYRSISSSGAEDDVRKLDTALGETRERMNAIDRELGALAARYPYLGSDNPLDTLSSRLDALQTQQALAAATLVGDGAAADASSPHSAAISRIARHEMLASDPVYQQLVGGSSKDSAQLAFDEATFTDRYPGLRSLRQKVQTEGTFEQREERRILTSPNAFSASQAQSVLENGKAQAVVAGDRSRVDELDRLVATAHAQLKDLPEANARFALLRVQHDAAVANYLGLASRRTQAVGNRAESLSLGSIVVFDRAVRANASVVGAGRSLLAVITAVAIVLFAGGMVFLAEACDPRLRRAEQIENLYASPLITTLTGTR
jgi:uncharacterized protein involved in exopolysaccharide biosynthesis